MNKDLDLDLDFGLDADFDLDVDVDLDLNVDLDLDLVVDLDLPFGRGFRRVCTSPPGGNQGVGSSPAASDSYRHHFEE